MGWSVTGTTGAARPHTAARSHLSGAYNTGIPLPLSAPPAQAASWPPPTHVPNHRGWTARLWGSHLMAVRAAVEAVWYTCPVLNVLHTFVQTRTAAAATSLPPRPAPYSSSPWP